MTENKALVHCVGITKYFGGVQALDSFSIDLHPGEIVALVGDNGAGKSTFVKILSGIYPPDDGEIWIGDEKVENLNPGRARTPWESRPSTSISRSPTISAPPPTSCSARNRCASASGRCA